MDLQNQVFQLKKENKKLRKGIQIAESTLHNLKHKIRTIIEYTPEEDEYDTGDDSKFDKIYELITK